MILSDIFQKARDILTGEKTVKKETTQHSHSYVILFVDEDAPVSGGKHTCVTVMRCEGCPQVVFFPLDNFKLTTEEYQKELLETLIEKGYQPVNV